MKSLKTPKKSFKLSTVAKLTSSLKRTSVSGKERSKSTSSELATISEGRLARSKSLKTKKESTKIRMAKALETNLIIDQATAQKFGLPMGYVGKEMDEIDSSDQKFSMFEAAIAADLAYYQRSSSDNISVRSRKSSIGDDSVFSGDRQKQLNLWIPGSNKLFNDFMSYTLCCKSLHSFDCFYCKMPEGGREGGREATSTSISIFDFHDIKTL